MKVGSNIESDLLHGKVTRSVINDPANLPKEREPPSPSSIKGKNAGPTGNVLMSDANQVWDVPQAIEYVKRLAGIKPWILEEPTAPDEYVLPLYLSATFVPFFLPTGHCTTYLTRSQQYPRSCLHSARTQTVWHWGCRGRTRT